MTMVKKVPLPVVLLVAGILCPTELSIYLGGLRLPPYRLILIVLLPLALIRMARRQGVVLRDFDIAMVAFHLATVAAFAYHGIQFIGPELTPSNGLVYGGSLAVDGLGGYCVARAWIRDVDEFKAVLRLLLAAVAVAGLVALPETLFGQHFLHDTMQGLTGYVHPRDTEQRLGLTRAYGTFDHPIHLGSFCASVLALAWYGARRGLPRFIRGIAVVAATFTALSSAPLLVCGVQGALIVWDRVTRGIGQRAWITFGCVLAMYLGASMAMSRSPIAFIATGMTLDSWTGFYRLIIWENGLENVWANPWVGLGLADWQRPAWMASASIDAFWLVVAMRTGVPTFLLMVLAIGLLARRVVVRGTASSERTVRDFARAWLFSLIAVFLAACTVHYWNALYAYFFFFLGLGGFMGAPLRTVARARPEISCTARPSRRPLISRPAMEWG